MCIFLAFQCRFPTTFNVPSDCQGRNICKGTGGVNTDLQVYLIKVKWFQVFWPTLYLLRAKLNAYFSRFSMSLSHHVKASI